MSRMRPEWSEIDCLFAALVTDPASGDQVVGLTTGDGWLPMVVATRADLDTMLGQIQPIADRMGKPIRVVKFGRDSLVGEFRPGGSK